LDFTILRLGFSGMITSEIFSRLRRPQSLIHILASAM
jgi:hypothetical protein